MKRTAQSELASLRKEVRHLSLIVGETAALHERVGILTAQRDELAHQAQILKRWLLERERRCQAYEKRLASLVIERPRIEFAGGTVPAPKLPDSLMGEGC